MSDFRTVVSTQEPHMPSAPTDLSVVRRPLNKAQGLPNPHYVDPAVFEEEKHALLFSQWAGLAVGADVPEPGDAKPLDFLGMPLLLLRDREGHVRVFQNICRHRGMILVDKPRKIEGAIRCPYHSWCYSTKGQLVSTPHVGGPGHNTHEDIDRSTLGLIEVRSHIWRDVVWINISGDAPAFEEAMSDITERWAEFEQPVYHGGPESAFTLTVQSNWKLAVENYCESYHLPWIHPGLNSYSRLEDHYHIEKAGEYSGQGTVVYRQLKGADDEVFPDFAGLSDKWNEAAEYISAYPNVLLGVHRDHAFAIVLVPEALDKTVEHVHLYYPTPDTSEVMRAKNATQWKTVFEEDIFVVEGMQRGRHASGYDGGRFSPAMDGPTHIFHDWVACKVETYRAQAKAAE
jgi:phenylpropionate dioxygenase-like ring-hydroxylating dioxygenase large terminal subunit